MCLSGSAPQAPPPLPLAAPPPPPAVLDSATDTNSTSSAIAASRGRNSLRIDKTQSGTDSVGSGLNIPT